MAICLLWPIKWRARALQGQDVFLPPQHPDRLWGPISLLWVPGALLPGFDRPGLEADFSQLVHAFKIRGDIFPLPTGTTLPFCKYYCDQMRKAEMGRACSTDGTHEKIIKFSLRMLKGIGHLEDICRCGWEDIIKMAVTEIGRRMPTGFIWLY